MLAAVTKHFRVRMVSEYADRFGTADRDLALTLRLNLEQPGPVPLQALQQLQGLRSSRCPEGPRPIDSHSSHPSSVRRDASGHRRTELGLAEDVGS